jgi:flagellar biosynthesis/type III secretory pathway protein FliH
VIRISNIRAGMVRHNYPSTKEAEVGRLHSQSKATWAAYRDQVKKKRKEKKRKEKKRKERKGKERKGKERKGRREGRERGREGGREGGRKEGRKEIQTNKLQIFLITINVKKN